ncbi:MAG: site-specific integrase [Clostridia bacterium]|nr:site-specific integrase [Clostridia bacterium]
MKYKEWLLEWLELYEKESVKSRTYKQYEDIINRRLIPALGEYDMDELTPIVLQRYVVELSQNGNIKTGKGLAPNSVNTIILVLHSSLSMAYILGFAKSFHVDKIKRPKSSEKPIESFSKDEQKRIEQAVLSDKRDKMFGVILCLYTGLRVGELLALEWTDLDFAKGELTISKTCYDGVDVNGKSCRFTGTPKTESSKRIIPIPKQILPSLKTIKKRSTSKYVIGQGNQIIPVRSYQRSFELLLKKHNIPHHGFHALRHTFATRAIECGMDVKSLSEILGHKNPTITLKRYVHSFMEHKRDYMNRVGKLF